MQKVPGADHRDRLHPGVDGVGSDRGRTATGNRCGRPAEDVDNAGGRKERNEREPHERPKVALPQHESLVNELERDPW